MAFIIPEIALLALLLASTAAGQLTMPVPFVGPCFNGTSCVNSCEGLPNDDYQSCHGCDVYVTCVHNVTIDDRPCPEGLVWDDNEKRCEWDSNTCSMQCPDVVHSCDYQFDLQSNDLGEATDIIKWSKTPPTASSDATCSRQGVLRVKLRDAECANEVQFILKFSEANVRNFSFDIGDSKQNVGFGGGIGTVDAEIHNFNRDVYLYDTSVVHNNALRLHAVDYVNNTMMINLKLSDDNKEVFVTNFDGPGPAYTRNSSGLFTKTTLYFGVNRAINDYNGEPLNGNVGSGLCSACVKIIC